MATNIPYSARLLWPSTLASVPGSWTPDTDFYDRYLQGSSYAGAGTNGGATTHGHTISGTHSHTVNSHNHAMVITGNGAGGVAVDGGSKGIVGIVEAHTHTADTNSAAYASYTTDTASVTVTSSTNHPPYFEFILVVSAIDSIQTQIPDGYVILSDGIELSPCVKFESADERFIKIAPTGVDGGGMGGSLTHTHATAHSSNHVFSPGSHTHADSPFATSVGTTSNLTASGGKGPSIATSTTHHTATAISSTSPTIDVNNFSTDASSSEPAHTYLCPWQNNTGVPIDVPNGTILPYLGEINEATEFGWIICDGTNGTPDLVNRQIKCSMTKGSVTGGSNTHSHTTTAHLHTSPAHSHTFTNTIASQFATSLAKGFVAATNTHTHTSVAMNSAAIVLATATVGTTSTDDIRYLYRTCSFITNRIPTVHIKGNALIKGKALIK